MKNIKPFQNSCILYRSLQLLSFIIFIFLSLSAIIKETSIVAISMHNSKFSNWGQLVEKEAFQKKQLSLYKIMKNQHSSAKNKGAGWSNYVFGQLGSPQFFMMDNPSVLLCLFSLFFNNIIFKKMGKLPNNRENISKDLCAKTYQCYDQYLFHTALITKNIYLNTRKYFYSFSRHRKEAQNERKMMV